MRPIPLYPNVLCFLALTCFLPFSAEAEVNASVKELMPFLKPVKASKEANPGDLKNAQDRMIRIIEILEKVDGTYGRDAKHVLTNAFYIYERDRFGGHRRLLTESTITQCWEKAQELGLFDKNNKFGFTIRSGWEKDKKARFEYIIPPSVNASFSTDLANLRLVTPATARKKGAELNGRENGYLEHFVLMEKEVLYGRPDEMGRTAADNLALWNGEVEKAGSDFEQPPLLRIGGRVTATPSAMSGNRWRVKFETSNLSRYPTQVTAEYFLFGTAKTGGTLYLLKRGKKELKLRKTESRDFEVWSDERIGAVDFRGWAIQVHHDGKLVGKAASQPIIYDLIARAGTLPRMGSTKKSRRKK